MNPRLSLLLLISLCTITNIFAQSRASEGKVDYQGKKTAAIIEVPYASDVVEDAIKENMAARGIKGTSTRGFTVYRNSKVTHDRDEQGDFYFKVERKSRKDKDVSIVSLIVGRPGENIGVRTETDDHYLQEGKSFLNDILPSVEAYKLEVDIKEQDESVTTANKKLQSLIKDSVDLDAKIKGLQQKMEENKTARQAQSEEIVKQQGVLDAMRGRRKKKD
ncbi:MAG: hypothetical protein QM731_23345 [Chitinophagaceae bacterium]